MVSIEGTYAEVHTALTVASDDETNGVETQLIAGLDGLPIEIERYTLANINDIIDNYDVGVVTAEFLVLQRFQGF